jgi:hypothetical protein
MSVMRPAKGRVIFEIQKMHENEGRISHCTCIVAKRNRDEGNEVPHASKPLDLVIPES